ncbi:MAG TPA: EVE domain-containing protein [Thermoanaerobaculia bacterium]|nr:EVE domain-containing protein [Thermoanaerobaculia bacterium]
MKNAGIAFLILHPSSFILMKCWLMKCEPAAYTIDDLERDGTTSWEGVRNFQARNFMREMKVGDKVFFYASNAEPSGVTGLAEVSRAAYPDPFATKKGHRYFDPKATAEDPIWSMVDIRFVEKFPATVPLDGLRKTRGLENMGVIRKGNRLSIQPVTKSEYDIVVKLGRKGSR